MSSLLFLQKFIGNPKQVGSVIPSSRFLARRMVQSVAWEDVRSVAELGSGTGAVTRLIKDCAPASAKVFLFEKEQQMRTELAGQYPDFLCCTDASQLTDIIRLHGVDRLDCVISCVPFFNFHKEVRERLMNEIVGSLKPGGRFIAFQYSLQMKSQFAQWFDIEKIHFVPCNFPPAFVYVCRKKR